MLHWISQILIERANIIAVCLDLHRSACLLPVWTCVYLPFFLPICLLAVGGAEEASREGRVELVGRLHLGLRGGSIAIVYCGTEYLHSSRRRRPIAVHVLSVTR